MVTARFRHAYLLAVVLLASLLLWSCGGEEEAAETPAASPEATEPAAESPVAEEVPGVTDTEIVLGAHFPLSQTPAAAYAPIADGMRAYFEYINSQGGIYGRKITFLIGDDHFNPSDSIEVTRKLVEQDGIFAMVGGLGDVTHAAVFKYLEEQGVPDMFIGGGTVRFTDPVVKTRFGGNPDYDTEGRMLGQYIAETFPGKKVAFLLENDEFGMDGKAGVLRGLEGSDVEVVATETYETIDWDVTAQTQRLKQANPDVIVVYAVPPPAASLVKTAREVLDWDVPVVVTTVVQTDIFVNLAGPENAEGVVSAVFAHQIYETDHPGIQRHIQIMADFGNGVEPSNFTAYGQLIAELMVKSLENAGPNLTRESLVDGAEAIRDWCCTTCMAPINLSPTDHRPFEIEIYNRVEDGRWVTFGEPVNLESTPGEAIGCDDMGEPVFPDEGE
jgi:branched-chain amino acid transport system substrate-binding protein